MNFEALKALLTLIRSKEAPKGYGQVYGGSPIKTDVSKITLNEVRAFQKRMLARGARSSAVGGYQFIKDTLLQTIAEMGLSGYEIWVPELQDRMAVHLMNKRGLQRYMDGKLSRLDFANNLAMEWASLPVVTRINGRKVGQSYYHGDGLNKAHITPGVILAHIDALKVASAAPPPPDVPSVPPPVPQKPRGLLSAFIELIMAIFKKG